jgi:hypothetical protein
MGLLFDSFWRAVAYCFRPRIILLSLLPLIIMGVITALLAHFYWGAAVAGAAGWIDSSRLIAIVLRVLQLVGLSNLDPADLTRVFAPIIVVVLVAPIVVIVALLLAALLISPAVLRIVAARRFPELGRHGPDSFWRSGFWSLGHTLVALVALLVSLPFWLIPPLILILPPLIWGWLTYRVMSHDALDVHASVAERRALLRTHRVPLLVMGVICGYLGAAPAVIWASFAVFAVAFVVLIPIGVWIYTLVFVFSALWFTHYCLAALELQRAASESMPDLRASADGGRSEPILPLPYDR